jgi:hypothetical protein
MLEPIRYISILIMICQYISGFCFMGRPQGRWQHLVYEFRRLPLRDKCPLQPRVVVFFARCSQPKNMSKLKTFFAESPYNRSILHRYELSVDLHCRQRVWQACRRSIQCNAVSTVVKLEKLESRTRAWTPPFEDPLRAQEAASGTKIVYDLRRRTSSAQLGGRI